MTYLGIGSPIPDIANLPGQTGPGVEVTLDYPSSSACFNASPFLPSEATPAGGTFSATPSGLNINSSTGEVTPIGSTEQAYVIAYNVGGETSQFSLTISPSQQATFSYSASSFANTGTTSPTLAGGTVAGGTFSASPAGLSINSGTGEINLAASTPGGPYVVTYSTPGPCVGSAEFTITSITGVGTGLANVYSMEFDGVNDYYATNFANFPASLTDNFSVSFWVKMAPVSSGTYTRRHPVSVSTSVTAIDQTVHLRAWNTQYLVRIIGSVSPTGGVGTTDISDNQWHNIIYTYNYDAGTTYYTVNVYVDGNTTPEVTAVMRTTGGYKTQGLHTIGVLSNYVAPYSLNAGTYFPGFIDEVGLFDYVLTTSQIQEIYNATASGVTANLSTMATPPVAWYRMGD